MNLNTTATLPSNDGSSLKFSPIITSTATEFIVIGLKESITSSNINSIFGPSDYGLAQTSLLDSALSSIKDSGNTSTFLPNGLKVTIIILPAAANISRNNHIFSPHKIHESLNALHSSAVDKSVQICVLDELIEEFVGCTAAAIARALPLYHSKSSKKSDDAAKDAGVNVTYFNQDGEPMQNDVLYNVATATADGVRLAAQLGDMPPAELNPDVYAAKCKCIVDELVADGANVTYSEINGEELKAGGYGGIYGVGMAAMSPPRLVIMTYSPEAEGVEHVALCGKGVIYDTGGLSLKPREGMCGMKHDMGGSAGVLGAFQAAVQLKLPKKITLLLAIVENAIGPESLRHDDIITMKSGKTVEINNTDAEGRLILSDCVAHASSSIGKVDIILDMATLTGAVMITTGGKHAGVLTKSKELEDRIFNAGMKSGDLVFPLLYAPELLKPEFDSKVADMKNSVKDRMNAQASCAGHFIESHISEDYEGDWVHCDMAGPDSLNERATGYGVALVLGLLRAPGFY